MLPLDVIRADESVEIEIGKVSGGHANEVGDQACIQTQGSITAQDLQADQTHLVGRDRVFTFLNASNVPL